MKAVADDLCQRIELDRRRLMSTDVQSDVEPPPRLPLPADRSCARIALIPAERSLEAEKLAGKDHGVLLGAVILFSGDLLALLDDDPR